MERIALIVGATGLVGSELVKLLLERRYYKRITVLVRRRMNIAHPRLEQLVIDFNELEKVPAEKFEGADLYCTLGTTRKKAGSKAQFELVDYGYPMTLGRLAQRYGTERMLVVTAMGTDEKSMFFYSQVKGRLERDLKALSLKQLHFFRPSLIIGNRQEYRFGEQAADRLARLLPFLFRGPLRKYKPNPAKQIAEAMLVTAMSNERLPIIIPAEEIAALSGRLRNVSL